MEEEEEVVDREHWGLRGSHGEKREQPGPGEEGDSFYMAIWGW